MRANLWKLWNSNSTQHGHEHGCRQPRSAGGGPRASFNKRRVVRGTVSIRLQRGEAVGLLGPNGAGKTHDILHACRSYAADEGQVFIDGQDVTGMPIFQRARTRHGVLAPQETSIFRGLTVEQNIRAVLETLDGDDDDHDAALDDLMGRIRYHPFAQHALESSLSGGEKT